MGWMVSSMFKDMKRNIIIQIAYHLLLISSYMVWQYITSKGVGSLKLIIGTVNASAYTQVLEECLKPVTQDSFKGAGYCIFQQDTPPRHTPKPISTI